MSTQEARDARGRYTMRLVFGLTFVWMVLTAMFNAVTH